MNAKQEFGALGERVAERYYVGRGYTVVGRNVRMKVGEIDRIFQKDGMYVFVEVKTRRSMVFGYPEEAISAGKRVRMWRCVAEYCSREKRIGLTRCVVEVCAVTVDSDKARIKIYEVRGMA